MTTDQTTSACADASPARRTAWIALAILFAIGACSMADRYVLAILVPDVKRELGLSDAQIGLLVGPAIAILYAVMGVPLGHFADKINRVRFLAACLGLWSIFTGLGGLAANLWQLALSRVGVSAAEGGCAPASMSLMADYFPAKRRAITGAIYSCSTSVGILIAFGLGGFIAQHCGWRMALFAAAVPGVILALITLVVLREPARGALDEATAPKVAASSFLANVRVIFSQPIYRRAVLGATFIHVATSVVTGWGPAFLLRKFGSSASIVGLNFGLGVALIGASCVLASGWMIGRIGVARFGRSLRLIALIELLAVVFLLLGLFSPSFIVAVISLSFLYGLANIYLPTQFVVVQSYLPAGMRATGSAMGSLIVVLLVQGLAPPIVGAISDALRPQYGDASLGLAMTIAVPTTILSAFLYFRAARAADDVEKRQAAVSGQIA